MDIHERDDKFSTLWCVDPRLGYELVKLGLEFPAHFQHSLPSNRTDYQEYIQIPAWTLCELVEAFKSLGDLPVVWDAVMVSERPVDTLAGLIRHHLVSIKAASDAPEPVVDEEPASEEPETVPAEEEPCDPDSE